MAVFPARIGPLGYAFINFGTLDEAIRAYTQLQNSVISALTGNKQLKMRFKPIAVRGLCCLMPGVLAGCMTHSCYGLLCLGSTQIGRTSSSCLLVQCTLRCLMQLAVQASPARTPRALSFSVAVSASNGAENDGLRLGTCRCPGGDLTQELLQGGAGFGHEPALATRSTSSCSQAASMLLS